MKKILHIFTITVLFITILGGANSAFAQNTTKFIAKMNVDQNLQLDDSQGFIYYNVEKLKGETVGGSFEIKNVSDKELNVKIDPSNVLTSYQGEVYDMNVKNDTSFIHNKDYQMINVIKGLPETLTLNPNSSETVKFKMEIPKNHEGLLVGGIRIEELIENKKTEGITIKQNQAYTMGIWLKADSEKNEEAKIKKLLEDYNKENNSLVLTVPIENDNPNFLVDQEFEYKVFKKDTKELLFEGIKTIKTFSPKNTFEMKFNFTEEVQKFEYEKKKNEKESPKKDENKLNKGNEDNLLNKDEIELTKEENEKIKEEIAKIKLDLEAGEYVFEINGLTFDFKIEKEEASDLNNSVEKDTNYLLWILVVFGLMFAIIIGLLIALLRKKNKEEDTLEDDKE